MYPFFFIMFEALIYEALLDIIVVQIAFLIKRSYMSVPIVFIIEPKKVNKFWST